MFGTWILDGITLQGDYSLQYIEIIHLIEPQFDLSDDR